MIGCKSCCRFLVMSREKWKLEGVQCWHSRRWALHRCRICRPRTTALKPTCSPSCMRFLSSETRGFASIRPSTYSSQLCHPALQQHPTICPMPSLAGCDSCMLGAVADLKPKSKRSAGCKPGGAAGDPPCGRRRSSNPSCSSKLSIPTRLGNGWRRSW